MPWYAVYDKSTGRAVSFATSVPETLPDALEAKEVPTQPSGSSMWDEALRNMVPRPPKILRSRIEDLLSDPDMPSLPASIKDRIRTVVRRHFPSHEEFY